MTSTVIDCNQHYVTLENIAQKGNRASYPLRIIELSFDNARVGPLDSSLPSSVFH